MSNELSTLNPEILSSLIIKGDISGLDSKQRVQYVMNLCQRLGLDPLTQPFKILKLQGKEILYADKGATQQLCKIYGISTEITKKEKIENVYVVTVRASNKEGRFTDDDGAVTINKETQGDVLANALMKAVTKAKRRAVLAFCGLGMLDETEISTIPGAKTEVIDLQAAEKEDARKKSASVQAMQAAITHIKVSIGDDAWKEVLTWHNVADITTLEDIAVGKAIYDDMKKKIPAK